MSNYDSAYRLNEVPSENDLRHILERASEGDDLESAVESELENRESSTTYRPSGGGAKGGAIAGATFGYFASQAVPNPFYQLGLIGVSTAAGTFIGNEFEYQVLKNRIEE